MGNDRYAYTNNNPIIHTDPTGHATCDEEGNCYERGRQVESLRTGSTRSMTFEEMYGISFDGNWTERHRNAVKAAVVKVGQRLAGSGGNGATAFQEALGGINFTWGDANANAYCAGNTGGGCTSNSHQINFWGMSGDGTYQFERGIKNVVHELGHAYDNRLGTGPRLDMGAEIYNNRDRILRPNPVVAGYELLDWQQHPHDVSPSEVFADMFIAWTYDAWNTDPYNAQVVSDAQTWMNGWMP